MCVVHLSPVRGFAIRQREPDPRIDGICHSQPRQSPQRAGNACHRHRRRRAVSVGKPSGRADFRGHDRGRHRRDRRPAARAAPNPDPDRAGAARDLAGLAGVAATAAAHECLSADHWAIGTGHLLLDLRQQPLSAAHPRLGPDLGVSGGKPRRAVANHDPCRRKGRRCRGDRRGADHTRDHSHRRLAVGIGADRRGPIDPAGLCRRYRLAG